MSDGDSSKRQWKILQMTATTSLVRLLSQNSDMLQFIYAWLGGVRECIALNTKNFTILFNETRNDHENQRLSCHSEACWLP